MFRVRVSVLGLFGAAFATLSFFAIFRKFSRVFFGRKAENERLLKGEVFASKRHKILRNQPVQLDFAPCAEKVVSENRVSDEELKYLMSLLPASNTKNFLKIMKTFIRFSNYNENMPSFRSATILDDLRSLLHLGGDSDFSRLVNVNVLNLFSNLIVDDIIRGHLKAHIDWFFGVNLSSLYPSELVALLRLVGNFSMTDDACVAVGKHFSEVFEFIANESDMIRRQAWTILLNLSCNELCVDAILRTEAFNGFEKGLLELFNEKNEVILLKSIKFLFNVYQRRCVQGRRQFPQETILSALLNAKGHLVSQTMLVVSQVGSASETFTEARRLLQLLEDC